MESQISPELTAKFQTQLATFDRYRSNKEIKGGIRIFSFCPKTGMIRRIVETPNEILFGGADIMARLLSGRPEFKIGALYFEFENGTHPAAITPPSFTRKDGLSYYLGLTDDPVRDFLRVPLTTLPNIVSSDADDYEGNQVNFFAITEGVAGFHGKTFDASVSSAVFGIASAATPDPTETTTDVVFARAYSGVGQVPKEDNFQIAAQWFARFS
jgi:hypothetical protein